MKDRKKRCKIMFLILCVMSVVLTIGATILDIVPIDYISLSVEKFFTYNISDVVMILVMTWTFSITLIVFFIGRVKQRLCGVEIYKIIKLHFPQQFNIYVIIGMFFELLVTLIGIVQQWEITLFFISLLQIFNLIFVVYMIFLAMNDNIIIDCIKDELIILQNNFSNDDDAIEINVYGNIDFFQEG